MNIYKPHEFAEMIGVSVRKLQRWDNDKKLIAFRTEGWFERLSSFS